MQWLELVLLLSLSVGWLAVLMGVTLVAFMQDTRREVRAHHNRLERQILRGHARPGNRAAMPALGRDDH